MALGWSLEAALQPASVSPARWQVLQAVGEAREPRTVPHIARDLALTRQAVQRIVNELLAQDFITLSENRHHATAKLLRLTEKGRERFEDCRRIHEAWLSAIEGRLETKDRSGQIAFLAAVTSAAMAIVRSTMTDASAPDR